MMTQSLQCHMNTKRCFETGVSWFGLVFVAIGLLTWVFFLLNISPPAYYILESPNHCFAKKMFL